MESKDKLANLEEICSPGKLLKQDQAGCPARSPFPHSPPSRCKLRASGQGFVHPGLGLAPSSSGSGRVGPGPPQGAASSVLPGPPSAPRRHLVYRALPRRRRAAAIGSAPVTWGQRGRSGTTSPGMHRSAPPT